MSNEDLSLHDLAAIYALDALDGDDLVAFEAHLATCAACQQEVASFQGTASELATMADTEPPPQLRAELLEQIASTPQLPPLDAGLPPELRSVPEPDPASAPVVDLGSRRRRRFNLARPLLAAAAAIVVVAGGVALLNRGGTSGPIDSYVALVEEPDAVVTELEGAEDLGGAVTVAWSPGRDQVGVSATGLDDPPDGEVYALWLLPEDGAPVPAALFEPDGGVVSTVYELDDLDSAGWGITLEPEGGSDEPTLPIIYVGTL